MKALDHYYRVLEVEPDASPSEVREAYRDLVRVWHPERFSDDPRLQAKAMEKLRKIGEAYSIIKAARPDFSHPAPVESPVKEPPPQPAMLGVQGEGQRPHKEPRAAAGIGYIPRQDERHRVRTEPGHQSEKRVFDVPIKMLWGLAVGISVAFPVSILAFVYAGGISAAIVFNIVWITVLATSLKRK